MLKLLQVKEHQVTNQERREARELQHHTERNHQRESRGEESYTYHNYERRDHGGFDDFD